MRAYSYVRFSTPEQAEGDSLRRQTEATERYCERHALTLDTGLSLRDLGVSAYSGRNIDRGALATFLQAIRSGRVPRGSVLIVEALDRLSRANLERADELFRGVLKAGVDIVVLRTERRFNRASLSDPMQLSELQWTFHLANMESKQKAERIGAAWKQKRIRARESGVVQSRTTYAWLEVAEGKFRVRKQAAEVVRQIFRRAAAGESVTGIVRKLNDATPCFGRQKIWSTGYVLRILHSRAVVGEYQPRSKKEGKWLSEGAPVQGYYPAVVDEELFLAAQVELSRKNRPRGPAGENVANLFTGLLYSDDGTPMHLVGTFPRQWCVSSGAIRGKEGCKYVSFPYSLLEAGILGLCREIRPTDIMRADEPAERRDTAADLAGRLDFLETQIARLRAKLETQDSEELVDMLLRREKEKKSTAELLERVRAEQTNAPADALGGIQHALPMLREAGDDLPEVRARLKLYLRQLLSRVTVSVARLGTGRTADMLVEFRGGLAVPLRGSKGRAASHVTGEEGVVWAWPGGTFELTPARREGKSA